MFHDLLPNVGVQVRRGFVSRNLERIVGFHFHWLFLVSLSEIVATLSMRFLSRVGEGPSVVRIPIIFLIQRQRSPAAHLVRRTVRRLVRRIHLAVWLFHFPFIPESVLPLYLCVALSRSVHFLFERQRSPSAHLVRRKGGTPCWLHFSWLLLAPAQNRFRVVRALRVFSGGRSVVRALTIIFLANVRVQAGGALWRR